jgi:hypothetical protein
VTFYSGNKATACAFNVFVSLAYGPSKCQICCEEQVNNLAWSDVLILE